MLENYIIFHYNLTIKASYLTVISMSLFQVQIDDRLKKAIHSKAKSYGVPASSLVRIALVRSFLPAHPQFTPGNVFNADRDNQGKGIPLDDFLAVL